MPSLIAFELKKTLSRRVSLLTCIGVALLMCGIMALNVAETRVQAGAGRVLAGTEAIAYERSEAAEHAGILTPQRVREDLEGYRSMAFGTVSPDDVLDVSDEAAYSLMLESHDAATFETMSNKYYAYLLSPWHVRGQEPCQTVAGLSSDEEGDFYGAVDARYQELIHGGNGWDYTDAEVAYWTSRQAAVSRPLSYGYAGGWVDVLDCLGFLAFPMIAICVVLAPVFSSEYQDGTDAVILATRHGRGRLVTAKVAASLLFSTAYFALCAAILCGIALGAFGVEGGDLPVQLVSVTAPYALTMGQAVAVGVALAYLMAMGFAALTLALSSRTRSTLSVFMVDVVLVLMTALIPTGDVDLLERLSYLFPTNALAPSPLFTQGVSYAPGPVVLDLEAVVTALYGLALVVCVPLSAVSFRRHQVA